jgi:hypothetical protein
MVSDQYLTVLIYVIALLVFSVSVPFAYLLNSQELFHKLNAKQNLLLLETHFFSRQNNKNWEYLNKRTNIGRPQLR